jgi:hypothetical protein
MRFDVVAVEQLGMAVNKLRMPTREIIREIPSISEA